MSDAALEEYEALAAVVGISSPDLNVERFKRYLRASGMTVYSLSEVIKYMDAKAAKESKEQSGWEWRPLREKDRAPGVLFGTRASGRRWDGESASTPASDYYQGPTLVTADKQRADFLAWRTRNMMMPSEEPVFHDRWEGQSSRSYDRTVPLHAVRKVARIEKEFSGDVAFFVCDYALAPMIEYPDPFLMAVIANDKVGRGVGRFIIDFWDEPGFGIEQMIHTDL